MSRKARPLLLLTLALACVGIAVASALAVGADDARDPVARARISDSRILTANGEPTKGEPVEVAPKPKRGKVVCPAIILKVGPSVMLPCARGARILAARSVEVDGRFCARVTYIAETGSPRRRETLCEGDLPSVGGRVD